MSSLLLSTCFLPEHHFYSLSFELILTGFDWVGAGPWGFGDLGRGLTISPLFLAHALCSLERV